MELLEISVMYVLRKDLLLMKESQSTKPAYTLDRKVNWSIGVVANIPPCHGGAASSILAWTAIMFR